MEKKIIYLFLLIVDIIIIWVFKKKDVLICWEEYIFLGRRFGDWIMNKNEVSRFFFYVKFSFGFLV